MGGIYHPSRPSAMSYTLAGEDPELASNVEQLRLLAEADGIFFTTADFGGVRTQADTDKILKYRDDDYAAYVAAFAKSHPDQTPTPIEKWRPIAPFGNSFHNWGCARDLKILKKPDSFSEAEALRRLGGHASRCGLRWGGNFKNRVDPPHFELAITLMEAKSRWASRHATPSFSKPSENQT